MNLLAQAVLSRIQGANERISTLRVVALDQPGMDSSARHVVTLQTTHLKAGLATQVDESTLTPMPVTLELARQRAVNYLQQRLAAGEVLKSRQGFDEVATFERMAAAPEPTAQPESSAQARAIAVLCARLDGNAWRRMSAGQQGRLIWRLAEYADPARGGAAQQLLHAQVPRLIALLETGDDLLDYCLAYLIGRLRDGGAAVAMQALSERGRSGATRDLARQAWLALLGPDERITALESTRQLLADQGGQAAMDGRSRRKNREMSGDALALLHTDELGCFDDAMAQTARELMASVDPGGDLWPAIKRIYKRAEWRHDHETLAVLHARFDGPKGAFAQFHRETVLYMRLRGWRHLRRLAAVEHSEAPALAVALLKRMDELCGEQPATRAGALPEMHWLLAARLVLPEWSGLLASHRAWSFRVNAPLNLEQLPANRVDGLAQMWNAHPQRLLQLVGQVRSELLLWSFTRALSDQRDFLHTQDASQIAPLLRQRYAPAAALGLEVVQRHMADVRDMQSLRPWLMVLAQCGDGPAADYLSAWLSRDRIGAAGDADLVASLLISPAAVLRTQGVALLSFADGAAVALALLAVLPTIDDANPALPEIRDNIVSLLSENAPLARSAASVPPLPLQRLLEHSLTPLVQIATAWLLVHPTALQTLPASSLRALLAADEPARVACGIRLLGSLPDDLLYEQADVLAEFAVSPHRELREAVKPIITRLAQDSRCNARIAERLHDVLFRAEEGEGAYDDALALLTGPLRDAAPARDASGAWRALQARASGAQRYGAWALQSLGDEAYSLRQWATLARHADTDVRARSRRSLDTLLAPIGQTTPAQAEQLLTLADARFADTQEYARTLFGERLPASALSPELLIAWVDHPQVWVQALGRQRLTQRMTAPEASMCLTRLSQHPSTSVQLFVTQWLLSLPDESPRDRAARLQELQPYFLAVLSQVHRARASKTRVLAFLRTQLDSPDTASVVAGIFARQVVSASLADQPDYVAGLRDIAGRHPALAQSFMQPVAVEHRASGPATSVI
ncbi:hypothetical protein [Diaphorobacter aerolatus]|uniref:Uncharacterized protein n=1 Tax=Diaphorobacter aerolatus TaxID=1288495 RepID=A0A7H0GMK0_9BURK|nr:hypothetical protein [Diaphorobacter aerolatus]QNP49516.1 hypothetical protein H9K75_05840 [Diaphorobacter aerolatus]